MRCRFLRSSTSLGVLGAALLTLHGAQAQAAEAVAGEAGGEAVAGDAVAEGGEITVTARRMSETLQDVPATVQVFTSDTLTAAAIRRAEDFIALTPGVSIVSGAAEPADPQVNIRGINGVRDAEPSVALAVDGILKTDISALNQEQGDLMQIEVLKGPQGAIYGRNATAGAFVMTTRKPGDTLEGRFRASYGNYNTQQLFGSLSGPLSEQVGLLLSGSYSKTRGQYQINSPDPASDGQYMDPSREYNINGRMIIEPTDKLTLDLKAHYGNRKAGSIVYNAVFSLPAFAAGGNPLFDEDANDHKYLFDTNIVPKSWLTTREASIKADYDLEGATLTAWFSYAKSKRDLYSDGTSAGFGFFNSSPDCTASVTALSNAGYQLAQPQFLAPTPGGSLFGPYTPTKCDGSQYQRRHERDLSGEVRIAGSSGAVDWMGGLYYLDIKRNVAVNYSQDTGNGVNRAPFTTDPRFRTEQLSWDAYKTRAYAIFGSADWKMADTLTLSTALRYDNERRKIHNLIPTDARTQYIDFDGAPFTGGAPLNPALLNGPIPDQQKTFSQVEPKVSLTFKPDTSFSLYANYGKGFKSGGFNNSGAGAIIDNAFNQTIGAALNITDNYGKETSDAFELGFKKSFGPLYIEGAGYYTRVKNQQFFEFFVGSFGILRVVSNIDRVDLWGAELSANYRVSKALSLFAGGNVTDSKIKKNSARTDTVGNKSPYTPDYTINAGTQIDVPLTDALSLVGRADVRVTGPTWFSTVQDQLRPTIFGAPGEYGSAQRNAFTTVNLRVGVKGEGWEAAFVASNLFNKKYLEEVLPAPEFGGSFVSPAQRRRISGELIYRF